jgi:hypothetical protein
MLRPRVSAKPSSSRSNSKGSRRTASERVLLQCPLNWSKTQTWSSYHPLLHALQHIPKEKLPRGSFCRTPCREGLVRFTTPCQDMVTLVVRKGLDICRVPTEIRLGASTGHDKYDLAMYDNASSSHAQGSWIPGRIPTASELGQ